MTLMETVLTRATQNNYYDSFRTAPLMIAKMIIQALYRLTSGTVIYFPLLRLSVWILSILI